jgi:hypothetical protein
MAELEFLQFPDTSIFDPTHFYQLGRMVSSLDKKREGQVEGLFIKKSGPGRYEIFRTTA